MMQKIKVLHIGIKNWPFDSVFSKNTKRGGGSNKYVHTLINGYADKIDSYIITQQVNGQKSEEDYLNGIFVRRIKPFGGRKLSQIIFNIRGFFTAIKIIKNYKIDIIHGHMLVGIIFSVLLGKFFNIRTIATPYSVYTTEFGFPLITIARFLERTFYRLTYTIVFESYENLEKALKYLKGSLPNSKVIVTGIDLTTKISCIHHVNFYKSNKIKLLFIGRLVNIKALDNLIYGISNLKESEKQKIRLDIIGEGEEYSKLEKIIIKEQLENTVFLKGFVKNTTNYLQSADVFILPSHMEGLSIALLEAMSAGLACIINDFGVPFNSSVYVMNNNKPKTITQTISTFILNPSLIEEYKNKAREIIEKEYSVTQFSLKYYNLYKSMRNQ